MRFDLFGQKLNSREGCFAGKITRLDGKELSEDDQDNVATALGKIVERLNPLLVTRGKKNKIVLKNQFTNEEKGQLLDCLRDLHELNSKYDFSNIRSVHTTVTGLVDLWIKKVLYTYSQMLKADREEEPDLETMIASDKKLKPMEKKKRIEALKKIRDEKTGDITIPTMLHFDLEAWTRIQNLKKSLEDNDGVITGELKDLNFRDKKIDALKTRCIEMEKHLFLWTIGVRLAKS